MKLFASLLTCGFAAYSDFPTDSYSHIWCQTSTVWSNMDCPTLYTQF